MAQGAIKKSNPSKKPPTHKHQTSKPNHRARVIKPKKPTLIAQAKLKKKSTSGLTGKTERLLAERAGHLEVLKGGKADRKKGEGKKEG